MGLDGNRNLKIWSQKYPQSIAGDLPYNVVVARKIVARRQKFQNQQLLKVTFWEILSVPLEAGTTSSKIHQFLSKIVEKVGELY